jgi:hypothetical protein
VCAVHIQSNLWANLNKYCNKTRYILHYWLCIRRSLQSPYLKKLIAQRKEDFKMLNTKNFALASGIAAALYYILDVIEALIHGLITQDPLIRLIVIAPLKSGATLLNIVMATIIFTIVGYLFAAIYNRISLRS